MEAEEKEASSSEPTSRSGWIKLALLIGLVTVIAFLYFKFRDQLTLANLADKVSQLRDYQDENPLLVYGAVFLTYVVVTGLSLPGATPMTLIIGWHFKFTRGVILVSFASTLGATVAFLLSRYLLRESLEKKFGKRLQAFNEALQREGAFYLFTLRLIPAIPFFVINVVMGLTRIRLWTYWWVSQIGMLAGTMVYTYAGSQIPDIETLAEKGVKAVFTPAQLTSLLFAFALLGIFPLAVKKIVTLVKRRQSNDT